MLIWFPRFYTEAHRTPERKADLIAAFSNIGVRCVEHYTPRADLVFCGSIYCADEVRRNNKTNVPVAHYNWDLYPHIVTKSRDQDWAGYLKDLKTAALVIVPNEGTATRTRQFAGVESSVVTAPIKVWEIPDKKPARVEHEQYTYVLDVMRDYSWDPMHGVIDRVCRKLSMPLVRTKTTRDWDEFRWLVAHAALLVSPYSEASTGGLTLLEGYAHGVPVLVNGSALNGAREYFGERARYFDNNESSLKTELNQFSKADIMISRSKQRKWVEDTHSDQVFANSLRWEFDKCLTSSYKPLNVSKLSTQSPTKPAT